jgi:hypothetical protein
MPKFRDIPQFTPAAPYSVHIAWAGLERVLAEYVEQGLLLDPDFQRAHVWTETQQIRYIEFVLRGGQTGKDIYTNHPGWNRVSAAGDFVLVDGKQRIQAVRRFLANEIPAFDARYSEYTDRMGLSARFTWHVNDLPTRLDVLRWYVDLNRGGVIHSDEEIARVQAMIIEELENQAADRRIAAIEDGPDSTADVYRKGRR